MLLAANRRIGDEGDMSEQSEFERQVREALQAEAEAGPDYRTVLHTRVMERVWASASSTTAPPPPLKASTRRMAMMALGAVVLFLLVLTIIAFIHH